VNQNARDKFVVVSSEKFSELWKAAGGTEDSIQYHKEQAVRFEERVKETTDQLNKRLETPKLADMAKSFSGAISKWAKSGFDTCTEEQYNDRLDICRGCEYWKDGAIGRCMKCGCAGLKLWLKTERCPIGKWYSIAAKSDEV
jgi:hypothetical protein